MLMRFFTLYIVTASILVFSLVYFDYPLLEKTRTSFLVFGIETEHETEEEHAMEEKYECGEWFFICSFKFGSKSN